MPFKMTKSDVPPENWHQVRTYQIEDSDIEEEYMSDEFLDSMLMDLRDYGLDDNSLRMQGVHKAPLNPEEVVLPFSSVAIVATGVNAEKLIKFVESMEVDETLMTEVKI